MRLRGTLRDLYRPEVLLRYLYLCEVLLKGFKSYSLRLTGRILKGAQEMAQAAGRPWIYLHSTRTSKEEICRPLDWQYYWTCCESEFATDVMFADPARWAALYRRLTQHALLSFGRRDVLRFLGRTVPLTGNSRLAGQVVSNLKVRPEGLRVKHRVGRHSLKMYDQFGRGLRVETTINECEDCQVYRRPEGQPDAAPAWRALRRGLADLPRRAQISRAANARYLHALAAVEHDTPLSQLAAELCAPVRRRGRRWRALNPWSEQDGQLLEAINRGEFALHGLRNRDLRAVLYPTPASKKEQQRRAARVSRLLALLRAHGLLKKVPHTHRYQVTERGRLMITALLTAKRASTKQLTALAA